MSEAELKYNPNVVEFKIVRKDFDEQWDEELGEVTYKPTGHYMLEVFKFDVDLMRIMYYHGDKIKYNEEVIDSKGKKILEARIKDTTYVHFDSGLGVMYNKPLDKFDKYIMPKYWELVGKSESEINKNIE
jgi:hypothetical protein